MMINMRLSYSRVLCQALVKGMLLIGILWLHTHELHAVEIIDSAHFVAHIINGESANAWSPDGKWVMLAEFDEKDKRTHLCVYDAASKQRRKCLFYWKAEDDAGIQSIDWTDAYIHIAVGFHDASVVIPLPVPSWQKSVFQEIDISKFSPIKEAYSDPAWDPWAGGLYFSGEDERYGIQLIRKGSKAIKYISGLYPAVTEHYLWYTSLSEKELLINGISRVEKGTNKPQRLTINTHDVSISPRKDETGALFIRKVPGTIESSLYAYVEGNGIVGPLLIADDSEEFIQVRLSPDGKKALLTSVSSHSDNLNSITDVRLLSLKW